MHNLQATSQTSQANKAIELLAVKAMLGRRGLAVPEKAIKPKTWPARHLVGPDEVSPVRFHLGQDWTFDAESRFVVMLAGTQAGKTGWSPWWLLNEIRNKGRGDYGAVTASYDLFKLKLLPAMQNVFCNITGIGKYWAGERIIEIRENASPDGKFLAKRSDDVMWARIILRSAEAEGGLESGTLKAVILDEAGQPSFSRAAWSAIKRRLAIHSGRALVTSTLYNLGWLKQDFIDPFDGKLPVKIDRLDNGAECRMYQNDLISLIQFDSIANPSFPMADYELARATMPPDEFEMFWRGRAAKLRTLIYDCYEPKLHDVDDFEIPAHWPRFVGIDPMGAHIAALWLAFDPVAEKLFAYREYVAPFGDTTEKHVKNILELSEGERILAWAGGGPGERQARLDWMNYGIDLQSPTEDPALKMDVWSQIMRVYATFKLGDLLIFKSIGNLKAELGSYQRYKDKTTNEMTDRILNKEAYNCLDALRYIVAYMTDPVEQREVVYMPNIINPHVRG